MQEEVSAIHNRNQRRKKGMASVPMFNAQHSRSHPDFTAANKSTQNKAATVIASVGRAMV
jgi:hypothetical protein